MSYGKTILRYLSGIPALIMLLLIFTFSAQDGTTSGSLSYEVGCSIIKCADSLFSLELSEAEITKRALSGQLIIRKLAHITEYFLLSLCFFLPLRVWLPYKGISVNGKYYTYRLILPGFFLSLLSAAADEFHQYFVPGRCGTPTDVLIDSVGIVIGCILLFICHFFTKKHRKPAQ